MPADSEVHTRSPWHEDDAATGLPVARGDDTRDSDATRQLPDGQGQFLGHIHHRRHHPHRPVRRFVYVSPPQRAHYGGVADRRGGGAGGHGRRRLDTGIAAGRPVLADQGADRPRPDGLRLRRLGAAGVDAALPARLPLQLPQDRHHRPAHRRRVRGQSAAAVADAQPRLPERRPDLPRRPVPVRVHLHHVRLDLRLPCAGVVRHDAEDDRQGTPDTDDRLRGHAHGGRRRHRRPDRRRVAAAEALLRHQRRPRQDGQMAGRPRPAVHGTRQRGHWPTCRSATTTATPCRGWSGWSATSRCAAAPAAP